MQKDDNTGMTYKRCFTGFVFLFNIEFHTNNEHEKNKSIWLRNFKFPKDSTGNKAAENQENTFQ
jgi:hypothetical protein